MHLPDAVVHHVMQAGRNEARIAVNKIVGGDPQWPGLIFITSALGAQQLMELVATAVQHAPDAASKEAWRALGLQMANAAHGAIAS